MLMGRQPLASKAQSFQITEVIFRAGLNKESYPHNTMTVPRLLVGPRAFEARDRKPRTTSRAHWSARERAKEAAEAAGVPELSLCDDPDLVQLNNGRGAWIK
jgi:hypothetical protein